MIGFVIGLAAGAAGAAGGEVAGRNLGGHSIVMDVGEWFKG
jgi:hypothetical protein